MSETNFITHEKGAEEIIRKELVEKVYKKYYKCDDNKCIHFSECSEKALKKYIVDWDSSYAAKVGDNYPLKINGKEVRIVVVGKESKHKGVPCDRPAYLNEANNLHYVRTYEILCEMLNYNWKDGRIEDCNNYSDMSDSNLSAFALTNRYRCAFKKVKGDTSAINYKKQTANCLNILREELEILKPTVLVIQNSSFNAKNLFNQAESVDQVKNLYYDRGRNCYIIITVHPSREHFLGKIKKEEVTKDFSSAVKYLRKEGRLPKEDERTTEALENIDPRIT